MRPESGNGSTSISAPGAVALGSERTRYSKGWNGTFSEVGKVGFSPQSSPRCGAVVEKVNDKTGPTRSQWLE